MNRSSMTPEMILTGPPVGRRWPPTCCSRKGADINAKDPQGGQALVALAESGALATTDPAYQRGVQFLLNTQFADGSWLVKTRAIPLQPLFEIGFPHARD